MKFGMQLNEANDNNKDAYLICHIRFKLVISLQKTFLPLKILLQERRLGMFSRSDLKTTKCIGVCTNGASSMSGCYEELHAPFRSSLWCTVNQLY